MSNLIKMSSIGQFRTVVKNVINQSAFEGFDNDENPIFNFDRPRPTLTFKGLVKIHGTQAAFALNLKTNDTWCQSKNNVVTVDKDNAGFAFFCESRKPALTNLVNTIIKNKKISKDNTVVLYGEFAGGNIQKGIAISGLDKFFSIFGVKIVPHDGKENYWIDFSFYSLAQSLIFDIKVFGAYTISIDFENPKLSQNQMIEYVSQVENYCPVGKYFGKEGIGEGIVWTGYYNGIKHIFKTKGPKHAVSKTKNLVPVDTEKLNSIIEFVDYAVTKNRLNQGIEQVFTVNNESLNIKKTGDFLRWVANDIIKEESDVLASNNLEPKDVMREVSKKARVFFINYIDKQMGLE